MKEGEADGSSSDGTDPELSSAAPSVSRVSSSTSKTNGSGNGTANSVTAISSPLRRTLEAADAAVKAHLVGNALVALGTEVVAAAAAAVSSPYVLGSGDAASSRLSSFLSDLNARRAEVASGGGGSNKSSGSEGSNSASPLSLNMVSGGKTGPKPRAADSPGSGSTTSTTTGAPGRDKVFVCPICNRSFGYKHVLQNHERTHTGEKVSDF